MLPFGTKPAVRQTLPVFFNFRKREEGGALLIEDHGGNIVVQQHPLAGPVRPAAEEHLERIVPLDPGTPAPIVAQQGLRLADPLSVCGAAQPKTVGE